MIGLLTKQVVGLETGNDFKFLKLIPGLGTLGKT